MAYGLVQTVAPAGEPVTLAEAKLHCRVGLDFPDDDDVINGFIATVRRQVERRTNLCLVSQTWELTLDGFPGGWPYIANWWTYPDAIWDKIAIRVPKSPLQSVASITYVDTTGVTQTLATDAYQVDARSNPPRIVPAYLRYWPIPRFQPGTVTVSFVAGFGAATAVPDDLKTAIKLWVAHLYRNRESTSEVSLSEVPMGVTAILENNWDGAYGDGNAAYGASSWGR